MTSGELKDVHAGYLGATVDEPRNAIADVAVDCALNAAAAKVPGYWENKCTAATDAYAKMHAGSLLDAMAQAVELRRADFWARVRDVQNATTLEQVRELRAKSVEAWEQYTQAQRVYSEEKRMRAAQVLR